MTDANIYPATWQQVWVRGKVTSLLGMVKILLAGKGKTPFRWLLIDCISCQCSLYGCAAVSGEKMMSEGIYEINFFTPV